MVRHIAFITIGLAAIGNLSAGYIQIGGNTGLTSTSGTSETVTSGSPYGELSYAQNMLQGTAGVAETSGTLCAGSTQSTCAPTTGVPSGEVNNEFATASGVTFAMINETLSGVNENVWAASNAVGATSTITIPIGIFGVTNVDTMLNDEYGIIGASPTSVEFVFSNPSYDETFTLVNGTVIRDDFDCLAATPATSCPTYATTLDTTNMYGTSGASLGAISPTSVANVTAFNVWSGTYSDGTGAYNNTSGDIFFDAQDFYLGSAAAGQTLADVVITGSNTAAKQSRVALSALTVETVPEPSTILLLGTGIAAAGLIRRRRKS